LTYLRRLSASLGLCLLVAIIPTTVGLTQIYQPEVGQDGKDVVWVPTSHELVDLMLAIAKVGPNDHVIDLGSGDGRTVLAAAKLGARALGIEYNEKLVELSKQNAETAKLGERATFAKGDIFTSDFTQATVVTLFLLPEINLRIRPKLLQLKPGTRVVSNTFTMGDWKHDAMVDLNLGCDSFCKAYLWIVPAKAEGSWQLIHQPNSGSEPAKKLILKQKFQTLAGTAKAGAKRPINVTSGYVRGARVAFTLGNREYQGTVEGEGMSGVYRFGGRAGGSWTATRSR
jgi:SAM-dependent methyltransferase